jgi:hypothetical protein
MFRVLHFLNSLLIDGGKFVCLMNRPRYALQEINSHSVKVDVMKILTIDIKAFVRPDNDPETGSKHLVHNNKALSLLGGYVDGINRILFVSKIYFNIIIVGSLGAAKW